MLINIVESLLNERGISTNKMLKDLGMGAGTFATWKSRGTSPNGETLSKLASYFGVSIDYLLTGSENNNKPDPNKGTRLSDEDITLLEYYHKLTQEERAAFRLLLKEK